MWILAVEVRQGTLGRGWPWLRPGRDTGRGWSWLRSGREHWAWMVVVKVWLSSGREHWAGIIVVDVRYGTLGVDGRG